MQPDKYTNIDTSVVGLSAEIIKFLKKEPTQKYNQLLNSLICKRGEEVKQNFLLALSFLFLLGKIKYHKDKDVLELLE